MNSLKSVAKYPNKVLLSYSTFRYFARQHLKNSIMTSSVASCACLGRSGSVWVPILILSVADPGALGEELDTLAMLICG